MSSLAITNIRRLVNTRSADHLLRGSALADLPGKDDAFLIIEGDEIADFGSMDEWGRKYKRFSFEFNAAGRFVLPCWCDSHTHLVFAGSRENEFVDKIRGLSYAEINAKGGGILNSAGKLAETSEDVLFNAAWARLKEISATGTGAVEIKSGYGLSKESELKMLRVIRKLKEKSNLYIKSTFLGAHTYPNIYRENHEGYIREIIEDMLPVIAAEKLADYIDVFCEKGFFSAEEMERICIAGKQFGLKPKLHVNQLSSIGGIEAGIRVGAISLDHLESMEEDDFKMLSAVSHANNDSGIPICTLLPSAAFFLRMQYQPARRLISEGCAIALASDYNPGSSPSGNMPFVISLACIQMKMMPEEAINGASTNGAYAMELEKTLGTIAIGKKANLIVTRPIPTLAYIPYSFANNLIEKVMLRGSFLS